MTSPSDLGLTGGALRAVLSKKDQHLYQNKPFTVQVSNVKLLENSGDLAPHRFRILLNDGQYSLHGLIAAELMPYCEANGFQKGSVITVKKYSLVATQKHIIIVSDCEIIHTTSSKHSNPVVSCDAYYAEHPEDDALQLQGANAGQRANSMEPTPAKPVKSQPKSGQSTAGQTFNPIELLSPYQNNWRIKARVSFKGDIRKWSNARGEGKLFNVNFLDESDEIRATAFNDVAEQFYNTLEEGKVYTVERARIQQAKPQFSHLTHPYELALDKDTVITECFDTSDVPKLHFNFTKLDKIQAAEVNAVVDVIGVLKTANPVFQITAKSTGKAFDRRNITIVDDSNFAIDIGLWNQTALEFNTSEGSVIAFKGCKVQDFGGRSLTLTHSGSMVVNPDTPEAYQLKGWYDNQGMNENFKSLKVEAGPNQNYIKNRKTILAAQEDNLGMHEKPDFFSVKATISYFKTDNFSYPACSNTVPGNSQAPGQQENTCNRKVLEQSDGWRCEKCNITLPEPLHRYILNCSITDETGQLWTTLFDQEARKLFGMSAGDLINLKLKQDMNESNEFADLMESITMKEFNFRLRARQDSYNGNVRIRYQTMSLFDVDFVAECDELCQELDSML